MAIKLSDHFTYGRLARFTLPTVMMIIFTSIYSVVDGLFVSNFVGKTPFSALNLIYPYVQILAAVGFMVGAGGTALVAKILGEGDGPRANRAFSLLVYAAAVMGVVLAVAGVLTVRSVAQAFGAEGELLEQCVVYGAIIMAAMPAFLLQNVFQSFFVAAGKPKLGLAVIAAAGITNIVLDAVFILVLGWGLAGAALATVVGQVVGGLLPLVYFARKNSSTLRLGRTSFSGQVLGKACVNGSSELMANISASLVGMLYNVQLMRLVGPDGVAAYGVIMYIAFVFAAIYLGFAQGSAPLVSFQYGAKNTVELKNLFRKCLTAMIVLGVVLTILAQVAARPLAALFVGYDAGVMDLTMRGLAIYSFVFLLMGVNIFGSAFFTALNNGLVSALIAFLRTLVFEVAALIVLPMFLGVDGVWLAIVVAELASILVTAGFFVGLRKHYGYA